MTDSTGSTPKHPSTKTQNVVDRTLTFVGLEYTGVEQEPVRLIVRVGRGDDARTIFVKMSRDEALGMSRTLARLAR
jgi:hypothetical protein